MEGQHCCTYVSKNRAKAMPGHPVYGEGSLQHKPVCFQAQSCYVSARIRLARVPVFSPGVCAFPDNIQQRLLQSVNTLTRSGSLHVGENTFLGYHTS